MLKLYAKLWKIHAAVERIEKDKNNQQGGYMYASEKAIKECLHPHFVKHGLILVPRNQELLSFIPPAGDKKSYITTILCEFAIVDLETGAELVMKQLASGGDTLDKGTFKAITGALKYLLTTIFLIPTGDDPEADSKAQARREPQPLPASPRAPQDPAGVISAPQAKRLFALANKAGKTTEQVKAIVIRHGYQSSKDILAKDYDSICAAIEDSSG